MTESLETSERIALILDDHQVVIDGVSSVLLAQGLADRIVSFTSLADLQGHFPDQKLAFAIIDLGLAGESGLNAAAELLRRDPHLPCIMTTGSSLSEAETDALRDYTGFFFHKQDPVERLIDLVRALPPRNTAHAAQAPNPETFGTGLLRVDLLTRREREVLGQIGRGIDIGEIADTLFIAPATVRKHREHIMEKLAVRSSAGLVRVALQLGLS
ncbi:response regulator transcription factor [Maricaulis parjimensis]|uniref:response regulator transcription factor n=1 Tax=Maricaulis parjimensis TaxID=144023 RepID=UPI001939540E|nr:response regulator transcription factor [Maricaulis parjimensis]